MKATGTRKSKKAPDVRLNPVLPVDASGYPRLSRTNGFYLQLTDEHIEQVKTLVGMGASRAYVARHLTCTEGELERAIRLCPALSEAIEHGVAEDEYQLSQKLRSVAMDGDVTALALYLKAKHRWRDKDAPAGHGSGGAIQINITGLLGGGVAISGPVDAGQVIDHE
jgi:hypothetical protein